MNKYIVAMAAFFLLTFVNGQTNFEEGYYVNFEGQRIDGLIRNLNWLESPEKISFIKNEGDEIVDYSIEDILEFGFLEGDIYKLIETKIPVISTKIANNDYSKEPILKDNSGFAKVLVNGDVKLLEYRKNSQVTFLVQRTNYLPEVLMYKKYIEKTDNTIRENNIYKGKLLRDYSCDTEELIQSLNYTKKSLTNYFLVYNQCLNPTLETSDLITYKQKKIDLNFKLLGGIQHNEFNFENITFEIINGIQNKRIYNFDSNISPKLGVELEGILPFNNHKWGVFISSMFTNYSSISTPENNSDGLEFNFEMSRIENNLGFRHFMFLSNKSNLFIEAGTSLDLDLNGAVTSPSSEDEIGLKGFNFGYFLGAGFTIDKISIKGNYFLTQSILENYNRGSYYNRLAFIVGYKI